MAFYSFASGIVSSAVDGSASATGVSAAEMHTWLWVVYAAGLVGTVLYLALAHRVTRIKWLQIAVASVAYSVWVYASGGAFAMLYNYRPFHGSVVVAIAALILGIVAMRDSSK